MSESEPGTREGRLLRTIFPNRAAEREGAPQRPATEAERAAFRAKIEAVLQTLTFRERKIVKLRYGIGDGHVYTLEEVGRMFKVTRERVRQIEAKAVRKLQHPALGRKFEGFLKSFE